MFSLLDVWIVAITSLAIFFDICFKKIPNWLILLGLLGGFFLNGLAGLSFLYNSFFGFVVGVLVFFVPFAAGWLGAGDVKYFGVVGCLLGPRLLPRVLFYSALAGGVLAVISLVYHREARGLLASLRNIWLDCRIAVLSLGRGVSSIETKNEKKLETIPWGVAIGIGTIFARYVDPNGNWSGF